MYGVLMLLHCSLVVCFELTAITLLNGLVNFSQMIFELVNRAERTSTLVARQVLNVVLGLLVFGHVEEVVTHEATQFANAAKVWIVCGISGRRFYFHFLCFNFGCHVLFTSKGKQFNAMDFQFVHFHLFKCCKCNLADVT